MPDSRRRSGDEQPPGDPEAGQEPRGMHRRSADHSSSWLTLLGFVFLTFNSAMAVHRAQGDPQAAALVVFSYLDLVLLFFHLRMYDRQTADMPKRDRLKVAVWLLTTLLTITFSCKVAAIMPPLVALLVWAMASVTLLGGFYAFFLCREEIP
ncbi:unnamed protein product [Urochloa humidicola]